MTALEERVSTVIPFPFLKARQAKVADLHDLVADGSLTDRVIDALAERFETVQDVISAEDDDLLAVKWVGPWTAGFLRSREFLLMVEHEVYNEELNRQLYPPDGIPKDDEE